MRPPTRRGLLLAAGIVLGWLASVLILLPSQQDQLPWWGAVMAVLVRTLLQTGLFIVAHDAMHGSLWPERPQLNRRIGQAALLLYAALPYGRCEANHHAHHRYTGTNRDPDHHPDGQGSLIRWYGSFMASYLCAPQITTLAGIWLLLSALAACFSSSPLGNVLLYCILPTLLSSLQLFLVGTYIPHHQPLGTSVTDSHQPRSLDLPDWLSLLSCYHFGYHWEHHAFPQLSWHELPAARKQIKDGFRSAGTFALPVYER